jgi:hypothetical protein
MDVFDTAEAAWDHLVRYGGLEVHGRDAALAEQLAARLAGDTKRLEDEDAPALVLGEILKTVTIEQLVNALFGLIRPFMGMMRDLLDYFQRAGITEGPSQWKLALTSEDDSLEVDLDHFKKYIKAAETRRLPLEVPVVDDSQYWAMFSAFRELGGVRNSVEGTDSHHWLSTLKAADRWNSEVVPIPWLPLPPVVNRMLARNDGLRDGAAILYEFAARVQSHVPNYVTLRRELFELRRSLPREIAVDLEREHDKWIEGMVENLAAFEIAPADDQQRIAQTLAEMFKGVNRAPSASLVSLEDLAAILDLPIWKRRYELYSAWVFTQFLAAMSGHDVVLHSENGTLTFGFHATKLATIRSLRQEIVVYGERRVAASNLKGYGRHTGIQPDYTVWTEKPEVCQMAIECKHYKKPSYLNFSHALHDYSTNLPTARVILGNYGPISQRLGIDTKNGGETRRQFAFGNLHPENVSAIQEFRRAVRSVFGDPISAGAQESVQNATRILAFDISPSMRKALRDPELRGAVEQIMVSLVITHFAAADDRLRAFEKADVERLDWLIAQSQSDHTALRAAADELRAQASELFFLTDGDGADSLGISSKERSARSDLRVYALQLGLIKLGVGLVRID